MEFWGKQKCKCCGKSYIMCDGPACDCAKEKEDWGRKYDEHFANALLF